MNREIGPAGNSWAGREIGGTDFIQSWLRLQLVFNKNFGYIAENLEKNHFLPNT